MLETIWNQIFSFYKPITDNVYIVSLLFGVSIVLALFFLQRALCYLTKRELGVPFGPISMMGASFIAYMTTHLPVLHPRMHRALSITSDIIQKSTLYMENFEANSGIPITGDLSIASFLYSMTEQEQQAWRCYPMALYDSVFRTMRQIRGGWFLPNADEPCFGSINATLLLVIGIVLMTAIFTFAIKGKSRLEVVWFFISMLFIIWMTSVSSCAAITSSIMWLASSILFFITKLSKKEPGSIFEP